MLSDKAKPPNATTAVTSSVMPPGMTGLTYMAFYDPLTQLPNRQMLMDRLKRALAQSDDPAQNEPARINGALMFIDLDNFKVLNDTLGHATGDVLLRKVATRLGACVRLSDTVVLGWG